MEFWNYPWNTSFLPLFPSSYKTDHIRASCHKQTPLHSKRLWVEIITMYSFYSWLFSFASWLKISEYWGQAILSQTLGWKECWDYYRSWHRSCFFTYGKKSKPNHDWSTWASYETIWRCSHFYHNMGLKILYVITIFLGYFSSWETWKHWCK